MQRRTYCLLMGLLFATVMAPCLVHAQTPVAPLVQTVVGIISFTRWPTPRERIDLCVVGPAATAAPFLAAPMAAGGVPVMPRWTALASDRFDGCDAVYIGAIAVGERRQLARRLEGFAVLTMGEAGPDCTTLTMFCLDERGTGFATNIDAIARGGVRVNPRVLLLGHGGGAAR